MEEFQEILDELIGLSNVPKGNYILLGKYLENPYDEETKVKLFQETYVLWKETPSARPSMALKFLNPKLNEILTELNTLFKEYDEQEED